MVTLAEPLLGRAPATSVGNVSPPSVERRILTVAHEIGATLVFATLQVTVWVEAPAHVTAVFGAVTTKGPAVLTAVRTTLLDCTTPPTGRLPAAATACTSRTVQRKVSVRATVGQYSPTANVPARRLLRRGKYRVGEAVGRNERNSGGVVPAVCTVLLLMGAPAAPRSISSQQYVRGSPLASLPVAVSWKGVPVGIDLFAGTNTVGRVLPVASVTGQLVPAMKAPISAMLPPWK